MDFEFIVTSDAPGNHSHSTRQLIRRRATREGVRTRRRAKRPTGVNLLQLPPWLAHHLTRTQADLNDLSNLYPALSAQPLARSLSLCPQRSKLALEELLEFSKHGMSRTLLGHAHHSSILMEPLRIQKILHLTCEQFFLGLGERYETSQCVNDAIDCLWTYVRQFFSSDMSTVNVDKPAKCYVRALNSMQMALNEGDILNRIDVWYATLILILYESFNASDHAWIIHSCGAIHILEYLGPQSIVSECQKMLLTAQSSLMITESVFQNKRCFLRKPEWQTALQSTIMQAPTSYNRGEVAVTLWMHAAYIPCIFRDATFLIVHKDPVDQEELLLRTRAVCEVYRTWYHRWQPQLEAAVGEISALQISEISRSRIEIFCCYLEHFCIINRLLLALDPASGTELEGAVVAKAQYLLDIYEQCADLGQSKYRMGLSAFVAQTIVQTTDRWSLELSNWSAKTSLVIEPMAFMEWCTYLGRTED